MQIRKGLVLLIVGAVLAVSSIWSIASWLTQCGLVDAARAVRREYLTGTGLVVIAALLILLPGSRGQPERPWPFD